MPITLPAKSRRHWLRAAIASPLAALAESSPDAQHWALFSDTHIAADASLSARGAVMAANLKRCVQQVLSSGQKPFGLLINGDCAYLDGQAADYQTLIGLLEPLREASVPVHCTLGNHDNRRQFLAAMTSPQDARPLETKHVSLVSSAAMNWVLLDSLEVVNATPGKLGAEQLGWLDRTLANCPNRPTVVMAHHNPAPSGAASGKHSGLTDSAALLEVLRHHSKVKAFVFGHTHQWQARRSEGNGLWLTNLPPTSYVFSAQSPAGWVMAKATGNGLNLELHCLNPNHEQHGQCVEIDWS